MDKSMEQSAQERREYVARARAAFENSSGRQYTSGKYPGGPSIAGRYPQERESGSTLGIRTIIAILLFAAVVYCDQEGIRWKNYDVQTVFSQIEWKAVSVEQAMRTFSSQ